MAGAALKVADAITKVLAGNYVGYLANCDTNLNKLRAKLKEVLHEKDGIDEKVESGKHEQLKITKRAARWLNDVRLLTEDVELRSHMKKDIETAKLVVNLMDKDELKKVVREDVEMQKVVLKVMKRLKKELRRSSTLEDNMKKFIEGDYKRVTDVVVEVMQDTTSEFKMIVKSDRKVAEIATKMLKNKDLQKLMKDDEEMAKILNDEDELSYNNEDEGSLKDTQLDKDEKEKREHHVDNNTLREAAKRLVTPLEYLLTGVRSLTADEKFKSVVPLAESVTLLVDVIDGLVVRGGWLNKDEMDDSDDDSAGAGQRCCGCARNVSASYFHDRYKMSVAAEIMAKHIEDDILSIKCPGDQVTLPMSLKDMEDIPTEFNKALTSRDALTEEILM